MSSLQREMTSTAFNDFFKAKQTGLLVHPQCTNWFISPFPRCVWVILIESDVVVDWFWTTGDYLKCLFLLFPFSFHAGAEPTEQAEEKQGIGFHSSLGDRMDGS